MKGKLYCTKMHFYVTLKSSKSKVFTTKFAVILTNTSSGQKGGKDFVCYLRRDYFISNLHKWISHFVVPGHRKYLINFSST